MCNSARFGSRRGFQCSQMSRTCFGISALELSVEIWETWRRHDGRCNAQWPLTVIFMSFLVCSFTLCQMKYSLKASSCQYKDEKIRIFGSQTYRPDWIFQWPIGIKFWVEMYHRKWSVWRVKGWRAQRSGFGILSDCDGLTHSVLV